MVGIKENDKFDLGVNGLRKLVCLKLNGNIIGV